MAQFLNKMFPIIHKELSLPSVPVDWATLGEDTKQGHKITTKLKTSLPIAEYGKEGGELMVLSTWLSTSPAVLAISWRPLKHDIYCDHQLQHILIISERDKLAQRIPVRACASILYATESVRNVLVAGTVLGDILIYKIQKSSHTELLAHSTGGGVIATLNWFKSEKVGDKSILISGHSDVLNTWIYDERHETCTQGKTYSTDLNVDELNPISIIETVSESSFCLYWRHGPLLIHDLNNHTTSKEKSNSVILVGTATECKGISSSVGIMKLKFVAGSGGSGDHLYVVGKHGDIYVFLINKGTIKYLDLVYRIPNPNIVHLEVIPRLAQVFCLNNLGELDLIDMINGGKTEVGTSKSVKHITLSDRNDHLMVFTQMGIIEIFSLNE